MAKKKKLNLRTADDEGGKDMIIEKEKTGSEGTGV